VLSFFVGFFTKLITLLSHQKSKALASREKKKKEKRKKKNKVPISWSC
jgi:hypothetical protein